MIQKTLCTLILALIVFSMFPTIKADCNERKENEKRDVPDWFVNVPEDESRIYASATAKSTDLRVAIRIASEQARINLARQIDVKVGYLLKKFLEEVTEEDAKTEVILTPNTPALSKSIVSQVLKGSKIRKQSVKQDGPFYRAYVLMELPLGQTHPSLERVRVYGYGLPIADATTGKKRRLSAYLAAIADACREISTIQEVSIDGLFKEGSLEEDPRALITTIVGKSIVVRKIGDYLKIASLTQFFDEKKTKESETHLMSSFSEAIQFEYAGHSMGIVSVQDHGMDTEPPPYTTKLTNSITSDIELTHTEELEKALEESGIKIENVEYLSDGLCKVTLLLLTDKFLTTLDAIPASLSKSPKDDEKYPPSLDANVYFSEPSGNRVLDANETGHLIVEISNKGKGKANDIKVNLIPKPQIEGLVFPTSTSIDSIGPQAETILEFPITASELIVTAQIHWTVRVTENGVEAKSASLTFMTREKKRVDRVPQNAIPQFSDAIAVILGIEEYRFAPAATFAKHDATIFHEYARSILGVPQRNIHLATDEEATKGTFDKIFGEDGWIARRVTPGKTDVFIFYSGHGTPAADGSAYLIPQDADPNYTQTTGVSLQVLYDRLHKLEAKHVTVFIDSCFSGGGRPIDRKQPAMLLADARPIFVTVEGVLAHGNMTVITASTGAQISSGYREQKHGLFSFYLLMGLQGEADANGDSAVTVGELGDYLKAQIPGEALALYDREQTPTVQTNQPERVLVRFR
jgi:hypothetical protein